MTRALKDLLMRKSREKKYQQFLQLSEPTKELKLLDVGVANQEYSPVDNYLEKRFFFPYNITALSLNNLKYFRKRYP